MSNIDFSSGPTSNPFSIYSTTNSILLPNHFESKNPPNVLTIEKTTKNNSGYHNLHSVASRSYPKEDLKTTVNQDYTSERSLRKVIKDHHSDLNSIESQQDLHNRAATISGFVTNCDKNQTGLSNKKQPLARGTTSSIQFAEPKYTIPEDVVGEIEKKRAVRDQDAGYSRNLNSFISTKAPPKHYETTYVNKTREHMDHKKFGVIPEDLATRCCSDVTAFQNSEFPSDLIAKNRQKRLEEYENNRFIHDSVLEKMRKKNGVEYDAIVNKRGRFESTQKINFRDTSSHIQANEHDFAVPTKNSTTGFKNTFSFVPNQNKLESGTVYLQNFDDKRNVPIKDSQKTKIFAKSAYSHAIKGRDEKKQMSLSDTLEFDRKKIKTFHPTVKKMYKKRYPAEYGKAVSTYKHKRRT